MSNEIEEMLNLITSLEGVVGTIVSNREGIPIKTTLDYTTTTRYAGLVKVLLGQAKGIVHDLDPWNVLTFMRVRSKKHELVIAPDKDFILVVIQDTKDQ